MMLIGVASVFGSLAIIALACTALKRLFKTEVITEASIVKPSLARPIVSEAGQFKIKVDGEEHEVKVEELDVLGKESGELAFPSETGGKLKIIVDGEEHTINIEGARTMAAPAAKEAKSSEKFLTKSKHAINAPMQGTVVKVLVKLGDSIEKGSVVLVLETMKMENAIQSPVSGIVKAVNVAEGDAVSMGDVLIVID
jgi:biotin carboxyl carrier protein